MTDTTRPNAALRDLVTERLNLRWGEFAAEHPHLAGSIERVRLIDSTVEKLADDPTYQKAMELAGADEALLMATGKLLAEIDRWVIRAMGL